MKVAFKKFGNIGPDVSDLLGGLALGIVGPNATSFSLQDIDAHNVIEHDGSLSRSDAGLGDNHHFNETYFAQAAAYFHKLTINITDAANARFARQTTRKKLNPLYSLDTGATVQSFVEQAFYLSIFGDPYVGVAQSDSVFSWFYSERLPTHLGWTPRSQETNLTTLFALAGRVIAAKPTQVVPPPTDSEWEELFVRWCEQKLMTV